ncbi:NAD(P)H-dependent oxidoreductase [Flagellimonas sp. S174]|uniref:NAD(P)H-dependent oxidoreductase n=1 Tax=Flagellimonas sp. S174 TaxID=3410790 RepID=UPI003BF4D97F
MKNVFIINGWHQFPTAKGTFNKSLFSISKSYFIDTDKYRVHTTEINLNYNIKAEVKKFVASDIIIYHTPIWWFSLPFNFKKYLDEVLTAGHANGIWTSDGRSHDNPEMNYGTGGLLQNKHYILTTSWNAPQGAFSLPNEFFNETGVDDGPMSGFHAMNRYLGMNMHSSLHFHDVEKNADTKAMLEEYQLFLSQNF